MSPDNRSFEQAAEEGRRSLTSELVSFVLENKKWWLIPILLVFLTLGTIMVLGSGGLAPFIYTLF
ncbi:MAG: DUF5989 family protein [Pirellulaceae bacterium]